MIHILSISILFFAAMGFMVFVAILSTLFCFIRDNSHVSTDLMGYRIWIKKGSVIAPRIERIAK